MSSLGDGDNYEIIFVDDASIDNSLKKLKDLSTRNSNIKIFHLDKNIGQWEATLLGLSLSKGEYVITIDADLQYNPADILQLYRHLLKDNLLLVYGIPTRMLKGLGGLRNRLQNFLINKSWTSSFKILHRSILFDDEKNFIPDRHFEAFEKRFLAPVKKDYVKVNTGKGKPGGFRKNMLRNINIALTYLPEYNFHFIHPFIAIGAALCLLFGLMSLVVSLSSNTQKACFKILQLNIITCSLISVLGIFWQIRYRKVASYRKILFENI